MNIAIKRKEEVMIPPKGYVFPFIDQQDMRLKARLSDGLIIDYSGVQEGKELSLNDYTSFQVYANDKIIPVGYSEQLKGQVNYQIPVGMTHKFLIRGNVPQVEQNVIVDWGDGVVQDLSQIVPTSQINDKYKSSSYSVVYGMSHTYEKSGKYIVKIYGNTYQHLQFDQEDEEGKNCNLICRVFDTDLPIASHVNSLDAFCKHSVRLLNVNVGRASGGKLLQMNNVTDLFSYCSNLQKALGFNRYAKFRYISGMFFRCWSLKETDFIIPNWCIHCGAVFFECKQLDKDIASILPQSAGFTSTKIGLTRAFYNCVKLKGTVPSDILWKSPYCHFDIQNKAKVFGKCSDEIRSQVPVSWGGTSSEQIDFNIADRVLRLEEMLKTLKSE